MNRIKSETQRLSNDPVVVIETVEQRKGEDGRIKKRREKTSKQLHKSMALEKRGRKGTLQGKHKRTSKEDRTAELTRHVLQKKKKDIAQHLTLELNQCVC